MIKTLLEKLRLRVSNDASDNRRRYVRRSVDSCVSIVGGKTYPVVDWSEGGVLMTGDSRLFGTEDRLDLMLKFRLSDKIVEAPLTGRIVRKARDGLAVQFEDITDDIRKVFHTVVDDYAHRQPA